MLAKELFNEGEDITLKSYLRKCGVDDVDDYLHPSGKYIENPLIYKNMKDGVQLLKYHLLQHSDIYIIKDGDVDGDMSTIILYQYLKLLDKTLDIKILLHEGKQRGLGDEQILNQVLEKPRPLVIIPDAGSNDIKQTREVFDNGTDILVIDHHDIVTPVECGILISNQFEPCDKNGSGCVVTHQFLRALDIEFDVKYSNRFLDLVALSIISDSMNVTSQYNRTYLYWGLFKSNDCIKNKFLQQLIDDYVYSKDELTQRDLSFSVIPKLNSVTRSKDQVAKQRVVKAFLGLDDLQEVSKMCKEFHKQQIETVDKFIEENKDNVNEDNNVIILCSNDIQRSYSGLIAGKMSSIYSRPCIVGKCSQDNDEMIGSLRSQVPLRNLLDKRDEVNWASGHEEACGVSINIHGLQSLEDYLNTLRIDYTPHIDVLKSYSIKCVPSKLYGLFDHYNALWSNQWLPKPMFQLKNVQFNSNDIQLLGKKKNTIKFKVGDISFIYFNSNEKVREDFSIDKKKNIKMNFICELTLNEWNGKFYKNVIVQDYEISDDELNIDDIF